MHAVLDFHLVAEIDNYAHTISPQAQSNMARNVDTMNSTKEIATVRAMLNSAMSPKSNTVS